MACLHENTLADLLEGGLDPAERAVVDEHLDVCPDCQALVGQLARAAAPSGAVASEPAPAPLTRGATVGRYVILSLLGSGGMGVVYAAYDPDLDRKVALKVLRPPRAGSASPGELRARIQREAKVMARLSHANVVQVYDADTRDRVWVAMELVDGMTLTRWLRPGGARRPWREVLAAFLEAGRGLAAAHAVGIVHRDFKPDNVLVGVDGRVRVTDFGLARAFDEQTLGGGDGGDGAPAELTRTGALMGTPAYMAPEQFRGDPADARTDVYAFCVALFEALYGVRPFTGADLDGLRAAVLAGRVNSPERDDAPARVRRALLRGLRPRTEDRPPTMLALLDELGDRRSRILRGRLAALAGLALLAALAHAATREDPRAACRGAADKLVGTWDETRKVVARRAFRAAGGADAAWRATETALDGYRRSWLALHDRACEATRVRRQASEEDHDLRLECLLVRLQDMRTLSRRLLDADARLVAGAAELAGGLPDLATCDDLDTLRARRAPDCVPGLSRTAGCRWRDETIKVGRLAAGYSQLVAVELGGAPHLVAYDGARGRAALLAVATDGGLTITAEAALPAGWTSLVASGARLVGYDGASGEVSVTQLPGWRPVAHARWRPGLWVTAPVGDVRLLTYDPSSGQGTWMSGDRLEAEGDVRLDAGWTHLVPYRQGGQPRLLAYDRESGRVVMFRVEDGQLRVFWEGGWGAAWTHWILLDDAGPHVLGYRADDGHATIDRLNAVLLDGHVERTPRLVTDQRAGYSHVLALRLQDRPHLVAYRRETGEYLVDRFEPWD